MQREDGKPIFTDNHESFRRLLIAGGVTLAVGYFFGERVPENDLFEGLRTWLSIAMLVCGAVAWSMCFVFSPRQYAIYDHCLMIEWWYPRRKVIPFDEIREVEVKAFMGKRHIIVRSRGPNYEFGWNMLGPRRPALFAERLEESMNRRRFYAGLEPIQIFMEKRKESGKEN